MTNGKPYAAALLSIFALGDAQAQTPPQEPGAKTPVHYDVTFENAVHHEARIVATFRDVPAGPLRVQMSRSSPGRYAIHEFAKNVYSVSASDGSGRPLKLLRTDPYGWSVEGHSGTVVVSYTLFGDWGDGTYAQIDATHAHLNMPATFLWAPGYDDKPIRVQFHPFDPKWKIATQLPASRGKNGFWAPNFQYFMDSPTELSDFELREWPVTDPKGRRYTIRLAVHHRGTAADVDKFAEKAKAVTRQQILMFGEAPRFDFGTYTFIADYLPHVTGDGMEHRNSTVLTASRSLVEANFSQIHTLSHEFFHSWNVERLRPAELEPFDFTRANPTPSLWFAEGFTQYYGALMLRRAGESTVDAFLADLSNTLNIPLNSPARLYGSPIEMSLRAPFVDAAKSIDLTNRNIFTSYYPYGAVVALALDLQLRERFLGLSLDTYMQHLWKTRGASEKLYTTDDLKEALVEVTGDAAFAATFFTDNVRHGGLPDFAPLLRQAGLTLKLAKPGRGWLGVTSLKDDGVLLLDEAPVPGSALYQAGAGFRDAILSIDDRAIPDAATWTSVIASHKPGDTVAIRFRQRGADHTARIRFANDPAVVIVRTEADGGVATQTQLAFRQAWLGRD